MGNDYSQFETRFHSHYKYIEQKKDPFFGVVDVYRKCTTNYTCMMVYERRVTDMFPQGGARAKRGMHQLTEKVRLIRNWQNECTTHIADYRILGNELGIRVYADYQNHTLHDYLTSLRMKKFYLSAQEVYYILHKLINGIGLLRRMQIHCYELTTKNVFSSAEGTLLLNPLYFLLSGYLLLGSKCLPHNLIDERAKSSYTTDSSATNHPLKDLDKLKRILLDLSLYVQDHSLIRNIYKSMDQSTCLEQLKQSLPSPTFLELKVFQFCTLEEQ